MFYLLFTCAILCFYRENNNNNDNNNMMVTTHQMQGVVEKRNAICICHYLPLPTVTGRKTVCKLTYATTAISKRSTTAIRIDVTLSLRFNGHSPGKPGSAGVYRSKGWWKRWRQLEPEAPVKSSPPTNQHQVFFYRPNAFPVAQPTMSQHWR